MTERTHVIYRCFDNHGRLLYVGQTSNLANRRSGLKLCAWWPDVAAVVATRPTTAKAALRYERIAIANENPRHNIHHRANRILWVLAFGPNGRPTRRHLMQLVRWSVEHEAARSTAVVA